MSKRRIQRALYGNLKAAPRTKIQNPKWVGLVTLTIIAFVICGVAVEAQQPAKIPRIGFT